MVCKPLDRHDLVKKRYVSVWVDSMSYRPVLFEGQMDEATKTLTMLGEGPGPDGQPMKFKEIRQGVRSACYIMPPSGQIARNSAFDRQAEANHQRNQPVDFPI